MDTIPPAYDAFPDVTTEIIRVTDAVCLSLAGQVDDWVRGLIASGSVYKHPVHAVYPQRTETVGGGIVFTETHALVPRNARRGWLVEAEVGRHYPAVVARFTVWTGGRTL